ncbi:hypothetical protein HZ326_19582 [Fusarium oxysporum f. sp. albedinis]|nr:hypothetical protein HZ326_19582 [Fusarium oxysporum f. sp. albedinis]
MISSRALNSNSRTFRLSLTVTSIAPVSGAIKDSGLQVEVISPPKTSRGSTSTDVSSTPDTGGSANKVSFM